MAAAIHPGLQEKVACIAPLGGERSAALRTLRALNKQDGSIVVDDDENIKLVCSLRQLGVGSVNLSVFKVNKAQFFRKETVEKKLYILLKSDEPELHTRPGFSGYACCCADQYVYDVASWLADLHPTIRMSGGERGKGRGTRGRGEAGRR